MTHVTVVSVFYNRARWVDLSVKSLLAQTHPEISLLLVDDGSGDDTFAALRRYEGERVRVETHPNMGFTRSIKAAVESTTSPYVALLDSADFCAPERIAKQAALLDARPEIGVVGCRTALLNIEGDTLVKVQAKPFDGDARQRLLKRNLFHHGEVMFRRSVYDRVGGYRPFFAFAQDRDLMCRLSEVTHFHVIDEVLYSRYADLPGSVSATPRKTAQQTCFSEFAVYCHAQRLKGLGDPLDQYGAVAALMAPQLSGVPRRLNRLAAGRALRRDFAFARELFDFTAAYAPGPISLIGRAATHLLARRPAPVSAGQTLRDQSAG